MRAQRLANNGFSDFFRTGNLSTRDEFRNVAFPHLSTCNLLSLWKSPKWIKIMSSRWLHLERLHVQLSGLGRLQVNIFRLKFTTRQALMLKGKNHKNSLKVGKRKMWVNCTNQKMFREFRIATHTHTHRIDVFGKKMFHWFLEMNSLLIKEALVAKRKKNKIKSFSRWHWYLDAISSITPTFLSLSFLRKSFKKLYQMMIMKRWKWKKSTNARKLIN